MNSSIAQYTQLMQEYLARLQCELQQSNKRTQQLQHKVASYDIKLEHKDQQIRLLQDECAEYFNQCRNVAHIEEIIRKGQSVADKQIALNTDERLAVKMLLDSVRKHSLQQMESNAIRSLNTTLQQQCQSMHAILNEQEYHNHAYIGHSEAAEVFEVTNEKQLQQGQNDSREMNALKQQISELVEEQQSISGENQSLSEAIMEQKNEMQTLKVQMVKKNIEIENLQNERNLLQELVANNKKKESPARRRIHLETHHNDISDLSDDFSTA